MRDVEFRYHRVGIGVSRHKTPGTAVVADEASRGYVRYQERSRDVAANNGARPKSGASSRSLGSLVQRVVAEFSTLSGITPEQISGLRSTEDGWSVLVEVLDLERIPSTTSILSTYRVDADPKGGLVGYERIRRYTRASTDAR